MYMLEGDVIRRALAYAGVDAKPGIVLTGPTSFIYCNMPHAYLTTNGYAYSTDRCNTCGLRVRALETDDWTKLDNHVAVFYTEFDTAHTVKAAIREAAGTQGLAAWEAGLTLLSADLEIDEATLKSEVPVWSLIEQSVKAETSAVDFAAISRLVKERSLLEWQTGRTLAWELD